MEALLLAIPLSKPKRDRAVPMFDAVASQPNPRRMQMKALQTAFPLWARAVLLAGGFSIAAGAGLISYRLYMQPTTLTVAVGSFDGESWSNSSERSLGSGARPVGLR